MTKILKFPIDKIKLKPEASAPEWAKRGDKLLSAMSAEDRNSVVSLVFNAVCHDVADGLTGEPDTVFFPVVNNMFEAGHDCYFSEQYDGNETPFTADTPLCLICYVKVRNVLRACGVDENNLKGM